jgi:hypothetical protein
MPGCNATCLRRGRTPGRRAVSLSVVLTLNNSMVSGNTASGNCYGGPSPCNHRGGGTYSIKTFTLNNSTVIDNTAAFGGGIFNSGIGSGLTDSTVSGNTAYFEGGGIYNHRSVLVTNSTVSGNTALAGGGVYTFYSGSGNTDLSSSIVAANSAPLGANCHGVTNSGGYNLTDDTSCGFTEPTGDLIVADAMLGPLADNGGPTETHALLPGSPAIDAGPPTSGWGQIARHRTPINAV